MEVCIVSFIFRSKNIRTPFNLFPPLICQTLQTSIRVRDILRNTTSLENVYVDFILRHVQSARQETPMNNGTKRARSCRAALAISRKFADQALKTINRTTSRQVEESVWKTAAHKKRACESQTAEKWVATFAPVNAGLVEKTDKGILLSSTLNPLTNGYEIVTPLEVEKR